MAGEGKSHRTVDHNGFLMVRSTPVSSFGVFEYSAEQVGLPGDPNRIVGVYRPESELSSPETLASFQLLPMVDDHDLLSGFEEDGDDVMSPEEKGVDGVMAGAKYVKPWMISDIKIFSRRMQRALDSGKCDLSAGYTCDFVIQSGVFEGKPYEAVQINMRGNHLALVDAGRVPGARVLDSKTMVFDCLSFTKVQPVRGKNMPAHVTPQKGARRSYAMDNAVEQLKALLPALEQFLSEEATEPQHQNQDAEPTPTPIPVATPEGDNENLGQSTEPAAEPTPTPAPVAVPEGDSENPELQEALKTVKEVLAKLESVMAASASDNEIEGTAKDNIEGLQAGETGDNEMPGEGGTVVQDCENNGTASQGPAGGKNAGRNVGDAAAIRKSIYADMANKQRLYDRVSPVIGAFDHAAMTSEEMAMHAAKKIGLKVNSGNAATALDAYLLGAKARPVTSPPKSVGDSAFGDFDPIDAYLKGQ